MAYPELNILAPSVNEGALRKNLSDVATQTWAEVDGAERTMVIGTPQMLTASATAGIAANVVKLLPAPSTEQR